mmetsp:Transcript_32651/g.71682  ORF Transcript_32651/g.71682 Transcript_32651/m.71682 type:complete len:223 (+) Transcript_32651:175-843(+)
MRIACAKPAVHWSSRLGEARPLPSASSSSSARGASTQVTTAAMCGIGSPCATSETKAASMVRSSVCSGASDVASTSRRTGFSPAPPSIGSLNDASAAESAARSTVTSAPPAPLSAQPSALTCSHRVVEEVVATTAAAAALTPLPGSPASTSAAMVAVGCGASAACSRDSEGDCSATARLAMPEQTLAVGHGGESAISISPCDTCGNATGCVFSFVSTWSEAE